MSDRDVLFYESPAAQRPETRRAYTVDTTPYGGIPEDVVVTLYRVPATGAMVDESADRLDGGPSVAGNVITTPLVVDLQPNTVYLLEVRFSIGGNVEAPALYIHGKR
jgi:hypothetical protein